MIKTKNFELAVYERGDKNSKVVALVIPGRLDSKDYIHNTSLVDALAENGYYALSFDPPGAWESPGSLDIYTTTNYLRSIGELIEYLGNKPTILLGHSRGGSAAILGSNNPNVIGVVGTMSSYGAPAAPSPEALKMGFKFEYRDFPPGSIKSSKKREFRLPLNYFEDGRKYNPEEVLIKLNKPKLLIYSGEDQFTPSERIERLYQIIPDPKMLYKVNSEHDYRYHQEIIDEINEVILKFLREFIQPTLDKKF